MAWMRQEDEILENLPPSAQKIHHYLQPKGRAKPRELALDPKMPFRTIRYALKQLERKGLITKVPDLMDLRSYVYMLKGES